MYILAALYIYKEQVKCGYQDECGWQMGYGLMAIYQAHWPDKVKSINPGSSKSFSGQSK